MHEHHAVAVPGMTVFKNQAHSRPQVTVLGPNLQEQIYPVWWAPGWDECQLEKGNPLRTGGKRREWGEGREREMTAAMTENAL